MMEITNMLPAIHVTKENDFCGVDIFISQGDRIKVIDSNGDEIIGDLLFVDWAYDDEEDDILEIELENGRTIQIGMLSIDDIDIIN